MHRQMTDGFIVEADDTRIIVDQADNHIKAGSFSGTVGTQQTNDLTTSNMHRNRFNDLAFTI
jgi:hypothetical protein